AVPINRSFILPVLSNVALQSASGTRTLRSDVGTGESSWTEVQYLPFESLEDISVQQTMSALPPKADMCGATGHVCFGPIADMPFYSMTSSARVSSVGGTTRPSALAALRLITSSYLVGACTGRSTGFSPLSMRPTYPAASR